MGQAIHDDKGEMVAVGRIIEAPTEEKDVEMNNVTIVNEIHVDHILQ